MKFNEVSEDHKTFWGILDKYGRHLTLVEICRIASETERIFIENYRISLGLRK